jgi:hypothetical protein
LYGHFIAAAAEYGVKLANPCFAEYAHLFPTTAHDLWCRYPVEPITGRPPSLRSRKLLAKSVYLAGRGLSIVGLGGGGPVRVIRIKGSQQIDLGDHEFAATAWSRHVMAQGWLFRSERLFQKHADQVREHLRIDAVHQANVDRLLASLRDQADVVVGVHVRRGDYATFMDGKYFYTVTQYASMMQRLVEQLSPRRVVFLACSNAVLDPRDFAGLPVRFGTGEMVEDLYALAGVDLLVGPPSTFSSWASFYGDVPMHMLEEIDEPVDVSGLIPNRVERVA